MKSPPVRLIDGTTLTRSRRLRSDQTDAERKLWSTLRGQTPGVKFRRQHQIGSFIADFCCVEKRLIVELDGGQHATQTEADDKRTRFLNARGYRVLRFWNDEVMRDADAVATVIMKALLEG
jgi:elongation factor P--(R)-beta-lysine ligase